jgi:hypothetical protein
MPKQVTRETQARRYRASMNDHPEFPTMERVEKAGREDLAYWYRFLIAQDAAQQAIIDRATERFKKMGGMTPELSRTIGRGGVDHKFRRP